MAQPPYFYETEVEWTGQRKGQLRSRSLLSFEVAAPAEFEGHAGIWTPEHLFVSAINACFMTTFLAIAELSKLEFVSFKCGITGKLDKVEGQGFQITSATLKPRLVIKNARDVERANRILEKAEKSCLITKSIKTNVTLDPEILWLEAHQVA